LISAGELRMGPLSSTVSSLNRTEQLLLKAVGLLLVQLLICRAKRGERLAEMVGRIRQLVKESLARLYFRIRHPGQA
jgi:hypothetical protein